jgi:hypothetical protein
MYSVMQSNVPEPYNSQGRSPTHLNMPGGGGGSHQRFLYGNIHKNHPSKSFSTSAAFSSPASIPMSEDPMSVIGELPCPQGVQGDDCVNFQLWQENCRRYHLPNCDEQLQGIQTGRKTLSQVFAEQEAIIREVFATVKSSDFEQKSNKFSNADVQGAQDMAWSYESDVNQPCPQGIQGEDCEQFKVWLGNCSKYGINNCAEQLQAVYEDRKTLPEIFREQEEIIRNRSTPYQTIRKYSTSSSSGGEKEWN